jgi:hypothetical protein
MAKATKTSPTAVLQASEIQSMQQEQRVELFVQRDNIVRRAFSELGKLMTFIARHVAKGETVEKVLSAAGVHRSTISNARFAADAFAFVEDGTISEARYDTLTFTECRAIRKLKPDSLRQILKAKNYREELECVADNGCTIAEHKQREADKAALIDKANSAESTTETATAETPTESGKKSGKKASKAEATVPANVVKMPAAEGISQADLVSAAMAHIKGLQEILPRLQDAKPVMDALRSMVEGTGSKKAKKAA